MGAISNIVKNVVCFYIFMTAVMHLLPKSSYQKYVRFFGGLLLVIMLVSPILDLFNQKDYLLDKFSYNSFWQEMDTMQLDMDKMEGMQKEACLTRYENAIASDISLMAQDVNLTAHEVEVHLNEDYSVDQITMSVSQSQQEGIYVGRISGTDNSGEHPLAVQLKEKLTDFYQLAESQIQIVVQEG